MSISVLVICRTVLYPAMTWPPAKFGSMISHYKYICIYSQIFIHRLSKTFKFKITNSKYTNSKNYLCHHVHYQCGKIKNVGIFMAITKVDHSKYVIIIFKLFISLTFALGYLMSITTLNDKIKSQWTIFVFVYQQKLSLIKTLTPLFILTRMFCSLKSPWITP